MKKRKYRVLKPFHLMGEVLQPGQPVEMFPHRRATLEALKKKQLEVVADVGKKKEAADTRKTS